MPGADDEPGEGSESAPQSEAHAATSRAASTNHGFSTPRSAGASVTPTPVSRGPTRILEVAQDVVTAGVGAVLVALAAVLLVNGVVEFVNGSDGNVSSAGETLLDRLLLVLIILEIVHTVALSLRAHRLLAQPFIVVGLIAVIRRILFVLTPGTHTGINATELALLIAMVGVFVAALIAVNLFETQHQE